VPSIPVGDLFPALSVFLFISSVPPAAHFTVHFVSIYVSVALRPAPKEFSALDSAHILGAFLLISQSERCLPKIRTWSLVADVHSWSNITYSEKNVKHLAMDLLLCKTLLIPGRKK